MNFIAQWLLLWYVHTWWQGAFQTGGYTATQLDAARDLEPQLPGSRRNHISAEHRLLAIQVSSATACITHCWLADILMAIASESEGGC